MKIAFYTLGCKVNQYETQALEQLAVQRGHTLVPFEGEADAYVINTCTVTAVSDKKSRQVIRRARKTAPTGSSPCAAAIPRPIRRMWAAWGGPDCRDRGPDRLCGTAGADLAGAPAHHRPGQRLPPPEL